jgi:hypothetical protein
MSLASMSALSAQTDVARVDWARMNEDFDARGYYRVNMRRDVSEVRWGRRHTFGVLFRDAKRRSR